MSSASSPLQFEATPPYFYLFEIRHGLLRILFFSLNAHMIIHQQGSMAIPLTITSGILTLPPSLYPILFHRFSAGRWEVVHRWSCCLHLCSAPKQSPLTKYLKSIIYTYIFIFKNSLIDTLKF